MLEVTLYLGRTCVNFGLKIFKAIEKEFLLYVEAFHDIGPSVLKISGLYS